jgi:LPXTG-site transpeptidase (sortase) family protein
MTLHENNWNYPAETLRSSRPCPVLRWLEYGCWVAGILCFAMFAASWLGILSFQTSQAKRFEAVKGMRLDIRQPSQPRPGDPFGKVSIPRIGLSAMVSEGDDTGTLAHAVGHIAGTAMPESGGNVGLAGHRDTFFRKLERVRLRDRIELETAQGKYEYEVVRVTVVDPEETDVLDSSGKSELTLVTCYPFHYIGAAPRRFIVQSSLVGRPPISEAANQNP